MKKFRIPRKIKKTLKGNIWLYPQDEDGNSLMAFPTASKKDYLNFKKGIVRSIDSRRSKAEKKEPLKTADVME